MPLQAQHRRSDRPLGVISTWFPEHARDYRSCIKEFSARDPALAAPSPHLPFPALTINAGRVTICYPHRDSPNDAAGICLDWILGAFDARSSGQLVLHEPRKILALEPGRAVLFPSAIITHETIPISEGEWRSGVTGYAAGGLWRYMAQGFVTRAIWEATAAAEEWRVHDAQGSDRWDSKVRRYMTLPQLINRWNSSAPETEPS